MKILWFANTPCGASVKLAPGNVSGGWLNALEEQLGHCEDVELSICFHWKCTISPFKIKNTTYYPVASKKRENFLKRIVCHFLNKPKDGNIFELLHIIEAVNPDIIHIHGTEKNFGLIQNYIKIPTVVSIQGILTPYSKKYFSGIPFFNAFVSEGLLPKFKNKSILRAYNDIKRASTRERRMLLVSKNIIGRTDWDKRVTRVLAPNSTYYHGDEIIRKSFYIKKWDKKSFGNPIKIVTVMSDGLYKGLETIVNTAIELKKTKAINFIWIVVGQNETGDFPKIVRRWLKIDYIALNIELVGLKSEEELSDILAESDMYCQVSHIENSPNSVCEAMLVGTPIVASFAGGTDSLLENKKQGILYQDGDPYSCAGAILEISSNFKNAISYSTNARESASNRHDPVRIVDKLIETYQLIVNDI